MITGNLNRLDIAMLPAPLLQLLTRDELSLSRLQQQEEGKYDLIDDAVFSSHHGSGGKPEERVSRSLPRYPDSAGWPGDDRH